MVAMAAGAVLTLGACGGAADAGGSGSDALAASVEGQEITVGELQESSRELNEYSAAQAAAGGQQPQEITPEAMLNSLVQVPAILEYGQEQDLDVPSAAAIEEDLSQVITSPSERTVEFFRASAVYSQLGQQGQQSVAGAIDEVDVKVSPRYDTTVGERPNWLEEVEAPQGMPGQ